MPLVTISVSSVPTAPTSSSPRSLPGPEPLADDGLPDRRGVLLARPERADQLLNDGGYRSADAA